MSSHLAFVAGLRLAKLCAKKVSLGVGGGPSAGMGTYKGGTTAGIELNVSSLGAGGGPCAGMGSAGLGMYKAGATAGMEAHVFSLGAGGGASSGMGTKKVQRLASN